MRIQAVGPAGRVDENGLLQIAPARGGLELVPGLVAQRADVDLVPLRGARPAQAGEHDRGRLAGQQLRLGNGLRGLALHQPGAALVAKLFGIAQQLLADLHFLEACQVAQLGLEYRLGLFVRQLEALDQHGLRMVLGAHDADHFIEVQVGDQQAVEDVQPRVQLRQAMTEPAGDRGFAEGKPLQQQFLQPHHARTAVERDDVEIHPVAALEIGGRKQVRHERLGIHPVGLGNDHQPGRIFMIGFVPDIFDHGQLLQLHLAADLLQDLAARHLEGQRIDDDLAVLDRVGGAGLEAAAARFVHLHEVGPRRYDLARRGKVGSLDVGHDLAGAEFRIVQERDASVDHLAQIVRRDVGGHADGDSRAAVEQEIRHARGQHGGLVERAVEIRRPVHRAGTEFLEQQRGIARQPRFGVAHRGEGFRVVRRAPVALSVDDRISVGEVLRHVHHGFVAGGISMRMEFADHIADRTRRLLRLRARGEPEFAHGIDDAPLHRL